MDCDCDGINRYMFGINKNTIWWREKERENSSISSEPHRDNYSTINDEKIEEEAEKKIGNGNEMNK